MKKEYVFIVIAAIFYGTIISGGQFFVNLGLSLYELSLYPLALMSLVIWPIFFLVKRKYLIKKEALLFFVVYGLIGAIATIMQFAGVVLGVPVAIVAFLLYTQPVWTVLFGRFLLKEAVTARKMLAVGIAFIGIAFLIKPWSAESVGSAAGIISALVAGIFLSLWVIWGRKSGIAKQHYMTTTAGMMAFSAAWLLVIWPFITLFIREPAITRLSFSFPPVYWLYLMVFALVASMIPHTFFYRGVQRAEASIAGIILLLEPVSASILAWLFLSQSIGINVLLGGALILLSNYVVMSGKQHSA